MDRLTHISMTNCIKELDALSQLVASGEFSYDELADWIVEISWNLSNVFRRRRYDSDEFQHRLRKLVQDKKRRKLPDPLDEDDNV